MCIMRKFKTYIPHDEYLEYLRSPEWEAKKAKVFAARGRQCEECGSHDHLEVHHLTYERLMHERLSDLRILCEDCHDAAHGHDLSLADLQRKISDSKFWNGLM